ncbi:MAG: hypothetical protein JOZ16_02710 [Methylobacteriaceae bacterium]|nr:hypothetical protein [Methylobacteriaceae bacterium]
MAFAITSASGHGGKLTVRVPTPEEAVVRARDLIDQGAEDVTITITATADVFTTEEFERLLKSKSLPSKPN